MMAAIEDRDDDRPVSLKTNALGFVLGLAMLAGFNAAGAT